MLPNPQTEIALTNGLIQLFHQCLARQLISEWEARYILKILTLVNILYFGYLKIEEHKPLLCFVKKL